MYTKLETTEYICTLCGCRSEDEETMKRHCETCTPENAEKAASYRGRIVKDGKGVYVVTGSDHAEILCEGWHRDDDSATTWGLSAKGLPDLFEPATEEELRECAHESVLLSADYTIARLLGRDA